MIARNIGKEDDKRSYVLKRSLVHRVPNSDGKGSNARVVDVIKIHRCTNVIHRRAGLVIR